MLFTLFRQLKIVLDNWGSLVFQFVIISILEYSMFCKKINSNLEIKQFSLKNYYIPYWNLQYIWIVNFNHGLNQRYSRIVKLFYMNNFQLVHHCGLEVALSFSCSGSCSIPGREKSPGWGFFRSFCSHIRQMSGNFRL